MQKKRVHQTTSSSSGLQMKCKGWYPGTCVWMGGGVVELPRMSDSVGAAQPRHPTHHQPDPEAWRPPL
jgi:hypothetical protein